MGEFMTTSKITLAAAASLLLGLSAVALLVPVRALHAQEGEPPASTQGVATAELTTGAVVAAAR